MIVKASHVSFVPEMVKSPISAPQEGQENAIEVRNLVKRYPRAGGNSVDNISFSVRPGEIFGLLGPNGAGKSTTIGILTTSVRPTSGAARIIDIDVARDPVGVKQHIAVVPQQSNLDQSLHAREVLTFHASYHGVSRTEREARADALLKEFDLERRGKERSSRFSGGQAQRLMIARALMHSPDVLFLDEPTNNLDPQIRLFLWERIRALHAKGITILLTTHDMDEADQLCERIAIMDRGCILVLDTPAHLKKMIPGGTRLELQVYKSEWTNGSGETTKDTILEVLRGLSDTLRVEKISSTEREGEDGEGTNIYRLYAEEADKFIVPAVQVVSAAGGELRNLHVARPSLEDVFIYLTGRKLRL
jgi:ABC-2 type transport system ATP-binding protein